MLTQTNAPLDLGALRSRRGLLRVAGFAGLGVALLEAGSAFVKRWRPARASTTGLLLTPADLAGVDIREVRRPGARETNNGGRADQVIFETDRFQLVDSVVRFPSADAAHTAFQAALQTDGLWKPIAGAPQFGEESTVLVNEQGGRRAVSALLRRGPVLVRLTMVGTAELAQLLPYAREAEAKLNGGGADARA